MRDAEAIEIRGPHPIEQEHADYAARRATWKAYDDMYAGGEQIKANSASYLVRRQKEPGDVYGERLGRFFYENYVGSIIDWYAATLFRREPLITFDGPNERARRFFNEFMEDCDQKGTSLTDFFRSRFLKALVAGASYVLVDFPRSIEPATNRAEEERSGITRAYLVGLGPEEVVNWSHDERGNFEWVVVRTSHLRREGSFDAPLTRETRWTYYDKETFQTFRRIEREGQPAPVEEVDRGRHGLSTLRRVPIFEMRVSEGLWLMNKAGLLQLEHLNKSNALSWALTMGLFASPVVYSEREWNQIVGESYYIQLGPEDRFGWTEPEGHVYQIAADNLARLKEEIYRVCYLMSQASGPMSGAPVSGLSKQRDFAITQEVLRAYGDTVKDLLKRVLRAIETVRQDGLQVNVSGLDDFDIGDFTNDVSDAAQLLALGTASPTLKKEIFKKLALKYLCDVRHEVKDRIVSEIESS